MDGATISPHPHHSWLAFRVAAPGRPALFPLHFTSRHHVVSLTVSGSHAVRWITRGHETAWQEPIGAVHHLPRDDDDHTFVTTMSAGFESAVFLIPHGHLQDCLVADEIEPPREFRRTLVPDDAVLRACMSRLAATPRSDADDQRQADAARGLLRRIAALNGGREPAWQADVSVFGRRTMRQLVEHIDAHLRRAPSVADLGLLVGLSPGHFARKFRHSAGLSLQRFVNRRRLLAALRTLETQATPLASVALDLGFASQSHFTRLFSSLTGMTPAKYQKQFRRTVG